MSLVCDCSVEAEGECTQREGAKPPGCRVAKFCTHDWKRRDAHIRDGRILYICHRCGCGVWIAEGQALP